MIGGQKTAPLSMPPEKQTPTGSRSGRLGATLRARRPAIRCKRGRFLRVIGRSVPLRSEEPGISRVRIGTTNELDFHYVMSRHHPRITGMKLALESFRLKPGVNRVNSVCHNQYWARFTLGQKVAHRAVQRASESDCLSFAGREGEGAVNGWTASGEPAATRWRASSDVMFRIRLEAPLIRSTTRSKFWMGKGRFIAKSGFPTVLDSYG
jgi:hypothetical protein